MKKYHLAICGGGPAGMMAGLLAARAGLEVVVLEKHGDFLRDFRGDTVHPSTLEVMHDLGLLTDFLSRPHQKVTQMMGYFEDESVIMADFSLLHSVSPYLVFMPQWDFLNFLVSHAQKYPNFELRMQAEVTNLVTDGEKVVGLTGQALDGPFEVRADLVIAADGRHSVVRERAGLEVVNKGAPIDVLWMRISRSKTDPAQPMGRFRTGKLLVMLERGEYWQCGYVIPKGKWESIQANGLKAFREDIAQVDALLRHRVNEIKTWDDVKLLTVTVNHLKKWYRDGLLCIGDAAHAMSPVGGVGINLAIQDAVAAMNILMAPLKARKVSVRELQAVQRRRAFPTKLTQRAQIAIQNRFFGQVLDSSKPVAVPGFARWLQRFPWLRRIPARLIGVGVRPEHPRA